MKGSATIMSTYTADVSGVCSALYELGGMVVIHDPSGCNSTYNTHDELRWYDQDSLIFISGLSEIDAILGSDEKLVHDIIEVAAQLSPKFIAICGTPIPMMSGVDFDALAARVERETGIPTFGLPTNGMHSYVQGVGMALAAIAERFVGDDLPKLPKSVNILGVTPLDFACGPTIPAVQKLVQDAGYTIVSTWAQGSSLEELRRAGQAEVNLVVSSAGFSVAEFLQERFGIPYVVGLPVQGLWPELDKALTRARQTGENQIPFARCLAGDAMSSAEQTLTPGSGAACLQVESQASVLAKKPDLVLVGEAVAMSSLAAAVAQAGRNVRVLCPLETPEPLQCLYDDFAQREVEIEAILSQAQIVGADPLFKYLLPAGVRFWPLPHVAFSGRIYAKQVEDWTTRNFLAKVLA